VIINSVGEADEVANAFQMKDNSNFISKGNLINKFRPGDVCTF